MIDVDQLPRSRTAANRPLGQFALSGLLMALLVGAVSVAVSHRAGEREAVRDARTTAAILADAVISPAINTPLVLGEPEAVDEFDALVRNNALGHGIAHARLWAADGTIIYSDEHSLIGNRYELGDEAREALERDEVIAEVSDLRADENALERDEGKLLEVYASVDDANGTHYLFEAYLLYDQVGANAVAIWRTFLPITLGAILVLELIQFPLALQLTRAVRRARSDHERLLLRAVEASNTERRRIARDLHDGAVQDLVGVSLQLASLSERARRWNDPASADRLHGASADTRGAIQSLRSLFVEIYPPNLESSGLASALGDLVASLRTRGVEVTISLTPLTDDIDRDLGRRRVALVYRVAHEAIRNVERHALASVVTIEVTCREDRATVVVADDGIGFEASLPLIGREHFGLRMLDDLLAEAGSTLAVRSVPGHGTSLTAEVWP
jgi:signal transduction histidine kinase